jgi:hypothetical protein
MRKLQKELIPLLSVEGQPNQQRQFYDGHVKGIFFFRSVCDKIFAMLLLPKPRADRRGPQFDKYCPRDIYHGAAS